MRDLHYLTQYYESYNEDGRLTSRHGQVEYQTTMKYIHQYLRTGDRILEVGAGTGRYSLALAREGFRVDALELVGHNVEILKGKILPSDPICAEQGDALDLSRYEDGTFDMVLVLGPMYHLYTNEDKHRALGEALRVTKKGGSLMVSYCMNEATMIGYCFQGGHIHECLEEGMLTQDYLCKSEAKEIFELVHTEDIARIDSRFPVERLLLVATDGATNYMRPCIDQMDDETFRVYLDYHFTICERQDLIGASHHTLDILRK